VGKKKKQKDEPKDVDYVETTAEMLAVLATLDEVEARPNSAYETETGIVPPWSEIRLTMKRFQSDDIGGDFPIHVDVPLRRHDAELIIEVLWTVLHPATGHPLSAAEQLWDGLDSVVERIQVRVEAGKEAKSDDVAIARTLTTALAILDRPYDPDPDRVREAAMTRWSIRHN
jgi:hypothetical protein